MLALLHSSIPALKNVTQIKQNKGKKKTLHSEQPENERWSRVHPKRNVTIQHEGDIEHTDGWLNILNSKQTHEAEEVEEVGGTRLVSHPHC